MSPEKRSKNRKNPPRREIAQKEIASDRSEKPEKEEAAGKETPRLGRPRGGAKGLAGKIQKGGNRRGERESNWVKGLHPHGGRRKKGG